MQNEHCHLGQCSCIDTLCCGLLQPLQGACAQRCGGKPLNSFLSSAALKKKLMQGTLAAAFRKWAAAADEAHAERVKLGHVVARLQASSNSAGSVPAQLVCTSVRLSQLLLLHDKLTAQPCTYALTSSALPESLLHVQGGKLAAAFVSWREAAEGRAQLRAKTLQAVQLMQHRSLGAAWHAWLAAAQQKAHQRHLVAKVSSRHPQAISQST